MKSDKTEDEHLIQEFLSDAAHERSAALHEMEEKTRALAKASANQITFDNKKTFSQKTRENQDFNDALFVADLILEIKLIIYFNKMAEQIIAAARDNEEMMDQQYQRYLERIQPQNPYALTLPQNNQSDIEYQTKVLEEARTALGGIHSRQEEIRERIKTNWGADTWEAGLKIQADAIHRKLNAGVEKFEFLNVVENADGSKFDPAKIDPVEGKRAQAEFHKVNNAIHEFILEAPPPAPLPEPAKDEKITIGADAPMAPSLPDPAKYITARKGEHKSQFEKNAEVFAINESRRAYKAIDKPLIPEHHQAVGGNKINRNSGVRLALRYTKNVSHMFKEFQHKASDFVHDAAKLARLDKLEKAAVKEIVKLENAIGIHHKHEPHGKTP